MHVTLTRLLAFALVSGVAFSVPCEVSEPSADAAVLVSQVLPASLAQGASGTCEVLSASSAMASGRLPVSGSEDVASGDAVHDDASPAPDAVVFDFGFPRQAYLDYGAHDDGSIVEWMPGYYVAHSWSDYGKAILGLREGDEVLVSGERLRVSGIHSVGRDVDYEEVRLSFVGTDTVCLQTCLDGTADNRVVTCVSDTVAHDFSLLPDGRPVWHEVTGPTVVVEEEVPEPEEWDGAGEEVGEAVFGFVSGGASVSSVVGVEGSSDVATPSSPSPVRDSGSASLDGSVSSPGAR